MEIFRYNPVLYSLYLAYELIYKKSNLFTVLPASAATHFAAIFWPLKRGGRLSEQI